MAEMKKQTEFKLYKRDSVFFDQNTAPVNIAYAHEVNDVAILPLGAIEQHGPHCPNGLDSFNAICLAQKVAEKIADEARDDTPQALDAVWEEEQVKFFADQGCGESEISAHQRRFAGAVAPQYLNISNGGQQ